MGQRSATETLAGVYQAFLSRRTWKQSDLARELGISPEVLRRVLHELQEKGMPLEREEDHPQVYWSVRKHWYPGSVVFKQEEVPELLRQLRRIPHGQGRARLLALVLDRFPAMAGEPAAAASAANVIVTREASPDEERHLATIEDSANQRTALHMRYLTSERADEGTRHVQVHRVLLGPPVRFVATCHPDGKLKTFRADSVLEARLDPHEPFRAAEDAAVDAVINKSLDGFEGEGPTSTLSFLVRNPEARWVKKNLLPGMTFERSGDGVRVSVNTSALHRLARFVVGLGAAATPETPVLAREVAALAQGALDAIASAGEQPRSRV